MQTSTPSRTPIVFTLLLVFALALAFARDGLAGQADTAQQAIQESTRLYLPLVLRHFSFLPSSGLLDPSFSTDGMLVTNFGTGFDAVYDVAILTDGKIIAAGWTYTGTESDFGLARFNPDGSPDLSFNEDGKLTTDISGDGDGAYAMLIQPDGKIILAGQAVVGTYKDFALARFHPDGRLDQSFSTDGILATDFKGGDDVAYALALQPDGMIIAAGQVWNGSSYDFGLARYKPDGSLDPNFSTDGKLTTDFAGKDDGANTVLLLPDGGLIAAGQAVGLSLFSDLALARYSADGILDTTFGTNGLVTTDFGNAEYAYALARQPDGKLVTAGRKDVGIENDFVLVRYLADGALDTSFSTDGKVTTDFDGGDDIAYALALQPDGKIILAGQAVIGDQPSDFALARYTLNGSLDTSFSLDGLLTTDFGYADAALAIALQPDGRIVAAGEVATLIDYFFALARYK